MIDAHGFAAVVVCIDDDDDCLVASLHSDSCAYLMFQRHPGIGHPDDDGVYVEIDDQINSGFNIVERCVLTPDSIRVSLSQPLKGFTTLNASFELPLPTAQFAELQQMLNRIFAEHENRLVIEARG